MSFFKHFLGIAALIAGVSCASAGTVDSQGMPVFYLRGSIDDSGWSVIDKYRFTRQGDTYTLRVDNLDGEFKVSDDDWRINFGNQGDKLEIKSSTVVTGVQDGANFMASISSPVDISFRYVKGQTAEISFTVDSSVPGYAWQLSGTLPVLFVNVRNADGSFNNEIIDRNLGHKNYFDGEYWLETNGCKALEEYGAENIGSAEAPLPLQIKARGNYTRKAFAKKPFKIKLGAKQKLMGLSKSKHFALLAHADDNMGYLRNFVGFNLGHRIGLPWTPWQQPVELVVNGDYRGLYFITESIRVENGRVDIEELEDNTTDPALVSGGYIVELDNYDEDNQIQMEEKGQAPGYKDRLRITFDTPEVYSEIQRRFIKDQFTAMNNFIGLNSDSLWSYLDIDDAVRYYIVEEIISHTEAYHGSTYLFRDRGEGQKWHFSPLWDCGNAFNGPTEDFFYRHAPYGSTWIPSIRLNETFNERLEETWLWFMSSRYEGLEQDMDEYSALIADASKCDRKRWKNARRPDTDGAQDVADNSDMPSRLKYVKNHLSRKIDWLKSRFGNFPSSPVLEPERDTTPAAPLPDYAVAAVENVAVDSNDGPVLYFNLQGIAVEHPASGVFIRRQGATATTILIP